MKKMLSILFCLAIALVVTSCGSGADTTELTTVRIGYHANEGGATVIAVAEDKGYFAEEGIKAEMVKVESGPAEMAAMRASNRTLEMGYIGAGVSWNAMDPNGNELKFVFFDGLSDSEALIARKGIFNDANSNGRYDYDEIYEGLKGQNVYLETSTTPGGWLKSLIGAVNEGRPESEHLWIYSETSSYLNSYTPTNDDQAYRVNCIDIQNVNIPSSMNTASDNRADIAACFAPVPATILNSNDEIEHIAATSSHLPNNAQPSTWVASVEWMEEEPETVQKVLNALYKAANYRAENEEEACRIAEVLAQAPTGTYVPDVAYWPNKAEYQDWFKDDSSQGYIYFEALYNNNKNNIPDGGQAKSFEECLDLSYMLEAINSIE